MNKDDFQKAADIKWIHLRMYQLLQRKFDGAKEFNAHIRGTNIGPELSAAYKEYSSSLDNVILEEAKALVAAAEGGD